MRHGVNPQGCLGVFHQHLTDAQKQAIFSMLSSFCWLTHHCPQENRGKWPLFWEIPEAYASDIAAFYSEAAANAGAGGREAVGCAMELGGLSSTTGDQLAAFGGFTKKMEILH